MKKILLSCFASGLLVSNLSAQTIAFSEDFQQGIPNDWTITVLDTHTVNEAVSAFAPGWIGLEDPNYPDDSVAGATSYFVTPGIANRWLITPSIALGGYGNIVKWETRSQDASFPDSYLVLLSTTDTQTASFTDTIAIVASEYDTWTTHEVNLSDSGYMNQPVHIAFVLRSFDSFKLYLDDVSVRVDDPVGIAEIARNPVTLYPNPASSVIALKGEHLQSIRIFGANGQLLLEQAISEGQQIDLAGFQSGTYLMEIHAANTIQRQRFVKL